MASIDTSTVHPSELFGKELSAEVRRALTFCVSLEGIGVAEASLGLSLDAPRHELLLPHHHSSSTTSSRFWMLVRSERHHWSTDRGITCARRMNCTSDKGTTSATAAGGVGNA